MLFTDAEFLFYFLPISLFLHHLTVTKSASVQYPKLARITLFSLTIIFYGWGQPWWLVPFFICIGGDFFWANAIARSQSGSLRKLFLCCSLFQNLSLLALFKYWDFLLENLFRFTPSLAICLPHWSQDGLKIGLPAGISFYTFESISFVVDVYRREVTPSESPLEFFAFIGMFPRFIAGPIVRYQQIVSQLKTYGGMQIEKGLCIFAHGLFLKAVFADSFAIFSHYAFGRETPIDSAAAWIGVLAYAMQIYFDFSGYSLMAIGLGRCFGFNFPDNFKRPYLATGIADFWRRWHISLSSWLRDYVYIPLGGNRKGPIRTYVNLTLTMLLGGIWHGANWTFLIWGAWHGAALSLERRFRNGKVNKILVSRSVTFAIVCVGWVFFRSATLSEAMQILSALVGGSRGVVQAINPEALLINKLPLAFCSLGLIYCFIVERYLEDLKSVEVFSKWPNSSWLMSLAILTELLVLFGSRQSPFIYFQF